MNRPEDSSLGDDTSLRWRMSTGPIVGPVTEDAGCALRSGTSNQLKSIQFLGVVQPGLSVPLESYCQPSSSGCRVSLVPTGCPGQLSYLVDDVAPVLFIAQAAELRDGCFKRTVQLVPGAVVDGDLIGKLP